MIYTCPRCQSSRIDTRNRAKRTVGTLGTLAGAASGAAGVLNGARVGWKAGQIVGPIGQPYTCIAAAIIGGIVGGTTGCAIGASFGELADDTILKNCVCLACGYTFSANKSREPKASSAPNDPFGCAARSSAFPDDDDASHP